MPDAIDRPLVESILSETGGPGDGSNAVQMEANPQRGYRRTARQGNAGLTTWAAPLWDEVRDECQRLLVQGLPQGSDVQVRVVEHIRPAEKIGQIV